MSEKPKRLTDTTELLAVLRVLDSEDSFLREMHFLSGRDVWIAPDGSASSGYRECGDILRLAFYLDEHEPQQVGGLELFIGGLIHIGIGGTSNYSPDGTIDKSGVAVRLRKDFPRDVIVARAIWYRWLPRDCLDERMLYSDSNLKELELE